VPQLCIEQQITNVQQPYYAKNDLGDFPFYVIDGIKDADPVPLDILHFEEYAMIVKLATATHTQRWEQEPISLFHHTKNEIRYVEGKAIFMGTKYHMALRIEIEIMGDAMPHFGDKVLGLIMVLEDNNLFHLSNEYPVKCIYDRKEHKTYYTIVYDINNQQKKLLQKQRISSVGVNWATQADNYEILSEDALVRQLKNVQRAEEDGIIGKKQRKSR